MTKAALSAELERLRVILSGDAGMATVVHELDVQREEVRAQEESLAALHRTLAEARDSYTDLFECLPVPYVTLDQVGVVEAANQAAAEAFGVERAGLVGQPLIVHLASADRSAFLQFMSRCRAGEPVTRCDVSVYRPNGERVAMELVARQGASPSAGRRFHGVLLDLSARHDAEAAHAAWWHAARELQADAVHRFDRLGRLSRQMRASLATGLVALARLERRGLASGSTRRVLASLEHSLDVQARLAETLHDLVHLGRGPLPGVTDVVDLRTLADGVVGRCAIAADACGVMLRLLPANGPIVVRLDAARLRRVLHELLMEAVRRAPRGSAVDVTLEHASDGGGRPALVIAGPAPALAGTDEEPPAGTPDDVIGARLALAFFEADGGRSTRRATGPSTAALVLELPVPAIARAARRDGTGGA